MDNIYEPNEEICRQYILGVLEECFALSYKTSMTLEDIKNLPISRRKWFVNRLMKQLESESQPTSNNKRSTHIPQ